jgi:hypothetical protein
VAELVRSRIDDHRARTREDECEGTDRLGDKRAAAHQQQPERAVMGGSGVGAGAVARFVAFTIAPCIPSAAS